MEKRHYVLYLLNPPEDDAAKFATELEEKFGADNVYRIEGNAAFLVKTPERSYYKMLDDVGFNKEKDRMGLLMGVDNTNFNELNYNSLWDFIGNKEVASAVR